MTVKHMSGIKLAAFFVDIEGVLGPDDASTCWSWAKQTDVLSWTCVKVSVPPSMFPNSLYNIVDRRDGRAENHFRILECCKVG